MFRRLRIAASVFFAMVCLALVALWARSYWWADELRVAFPNANAFLVTSEQGELHLNRFISAPTGARWESNRLSKLPYSASPALFGFRWGMSPDGLRPIVPHGFLAIASGILAAAPWMRTPRRFTLRSIFVVITLVAAVLGMILAFR